MNAGNYRFKLTWSTLWHLLLGASRFIWAEGITIPQLVLLLDVSKWQGTINFVKMLLAGGKGAIIKCGQGAAKDLRFDQNWLAARLAGIPRGSYWFYDSRVDPKQQAANWWSWIKADPGELDHYLDLEESYGGPWAGWKNWKIFLLEFMKLSKLPAAKIGIYTGYYYWIANSPINLTDLNWFGQFALWLAWYTNDPAVVRIPKPWTALLFWQFGTPVEGEKYGTESLEIDESYFNGDEREYQQRFGLSGGVPPVVVEPPAHPDVVPGAESWQARVISIWRVKVRTYPQVADDTFTGEHVYFGEAFTGKLWAGNNYVWIKIEQATRTALIGTWVAVRKIDGSGKLLKLSVANIPTGETGYVWARIPHDIERVDVDDNLGGGLRYRGNLKEYANDLRGGRVRKVVREKGKAMPEVYRLDPDHATLLNCACQRLLKGLNALLNNKRTSSILEAGLMLANGTGFPGSYNCLTGEDWDQKLPRYHAPILTGGTLIKGKIVGSVFQISSMLISEPIRSAAEVLNHREWYFDPVSINPQGEIHFIMRPSGEDSDGPNVPVHAPFLTTVAVSLPVAELHILPAGFLPPSALWMPGD